MAEPIKVALAIPNEGMTGPDAYINRLIMAHHIGKLDGANPGKYEFFWGNIGRLLTPLARERLTEWAISMGCDYMLQIDDDMTCPPDLFDRLFETMQEHKADVVGALAFMRNEPHFPVIYRLKEGYDHVAKKPYSIREFVKNYPKDTVIECEAIGFGAALIRLEMVKRMKKPYFMSTTSYGEDVWFCRCAGLEAKAKIMMDTRVKLGHVGNAPIITEETYEGMNKITELRSTLGDASPKLEPANV